MQRERALLQHQRRIVFDNTTEKISCVHALLFMRHLVDERRPLTEQDLSGHKSHTSLVISVAPTSFIQFCLYSLHQTCSRHTPAPTRWTISWRYV